MTTATKPAYITDLAAHAVELAAELEAKIEETAEAFFAVGEEAAAIHEAGDKPLGLIWGIVLNSASELRKDARGEGDSCFNAKVLRKDAEELSQLVRFALQRREERG